MLENEQVGKFMETERMVEAYVLWGSRVGSIAVIEPETEKLIGQ